MLPKLLTIPQVAPALGVTVPRAYELARTGLIPIVRVGRQVRVNEAKLIDWIENGGQAV